MRVGIFGGGQLARMMAGAGIPLGLEFVIVDPAADACAAGLGEFVQAGYDDPRALERLAACDRVTCDFENVPASSLASLEGKVGVRPSADALAAAQDRLTEKRRFRELGLDTVEFETVDSRTDLASAIERIGYPAVLKTRRMGYDGKGQAVLHDAEDLELAWQRLGEYPLLLEQWIAFDFECAITAVRAADGELGYWPVSRTWHSDGILRLAASAPVPESLQRSAEGCIAALAEDLDYVGCLTLEMFSAGERLLANEFAPRVHNSGHWTIEGAVCSQFENHLRAVCGWPLGDTSRNGFSAMVNFIGSMPDRAGWLSVAGAHLHDYRKAPRGGRKVGHATLQATDCDGLRERLDEVASAVDPRHLEQLRGALG